MFHTGYLGQLARLEPDQAMGQLQKQPNFSDSSQRDDEVTAIAVQLATDIPAQSERFFNLRDAGADRFPTGTQSLQVCRRLARVDPRAPDASPHPWAVLGSRACGWAYVALGLAEKDKAGATLAMDRAIQEIDRLRESDPEPGYMAGGIHLMYASNPAAVILPLVERVSPDRLGEVFWRAVALQLRVKTENETQLHRSTIGYECMLLARYDRQVAAAIFEPVDSYLRSLAARTGPREDFDPSLITAEGCIDPQSAISLLESLTPPRRFSTTAPRASGPAQAGRNARDATRRAMEAVVELLHASPSRRLIGAARSRYAGNLDLFIQHFSCARHRPLWEARRAPSARRQAVELLLQILDDRGVGWLAVDVVQLVRVVLAVEELPVVRRRGSRSGRACSGRSRRRSAGGRGAGAGYS